MQRKIEFRDLNNAGQEAVKVSKEMVIQTLDAWGFPCGVSPFSYPDRDSENALEQAIVDFLVATNQPSGAGSL